MIKICISLSLSFLVPCYSGTVSFDFQLVPLPFCQHTHARNTLLGSKSDLSDSTEKHCFNPIFLAVSVSPRLEPYTQLLWPEIEANLLKQQHLRRCPEVHEYKPRQRQHYNQGVTGVQTEEVVTLWTDDHSKRVTTAE